uniref:RNA-directed DNA polymerase, eukaryota n=1 Tax=Tanacetum cinerariifolium TaxID=118510 RepID=A0A6L2JN49_TANCI|nr:RNA-directed DNA polymerase, eukaryota [Tanacetum cinerariifolium]
MGDFEWTKVRRKNHSHTNNRVNGSMLAKNLGNVVKSVARSERSTAHSLRTKTLPEPIHVAPLFVLAVKGDFPSIPALVKHISSIVNIRSLLSIEGFNNVKPTYMGGLWVMLELESSNVKAKIMKHVGVASWFDRLCEVEPDFVSWERIVWVDIEGVPLHAWSRATFEKIGSKWGEVMDIEEGNDDLFAQKRICIKTKQEDTANAKYCSNNESEEVINKDGNNDEDVESVKDKECSSDLFNIYPLLNKHKTDPLQPITDTSLTHPPGFTPKRNEPVTDSPHTHYVGLNSRIIHDAELSDESANSDGNFKTKGLRTRGSMLDVLDDMIKVGQAMGFSIGGCLNDMEGIIKSQGETKSDAIFDMEIKFLWGNSVFKSSVSEAIDHRPTLLKDVIVDYGAIPFRLYHSWLDWDGFGNLVTNIWNSTNLTDHQGVITDDLLLARMDLMKKFHDYTSSDARDQIQKAKIKWAIEGDENSKFFHGIINQKRANLSIKGVMVDGEWVDEPSRVKEEFRTYFSSRFQDPGTRQCRLNFTFPNRLTSDQILDLEKPVSRDEIRDAVWDCGTNKSPGPDGFSFESFKKFWNIIGPDICIAVEWFFSYSTFTRGCNSSFISLIPKDYLDDVLDGFGFGRINLKKSHLLGVGVSNDLISHAAGLLGYEVLKPPFKYLGIIVGGEDRKIAWIKWSKVLAFKKYGALGVNRFYALNRGLLFKWVWRFISNDGSLWFRIINAMHGNSLQVSSSCYYSPWKVILKELQLLVDTVILSNVDDRWFWDLNGEGVFCVKDARNLIDETFLPKEPIATRWLKIVPIKVNIFA